MPMVAPQNDPQCLDQIHALAERDRSTLEAQRLAAQIGSIENLAPYMRALPFDLDRGDMTEQPRIQCDVSQRMRGLPEVLKGRNCAEGTRLFLTIAPILAPERTWSSATVSMDGVLHTSPVEIVDGRAIFIDIDPRAPLPANVASAAMYAIRNGSPLADGNLAPWFAELARNACIYHGSGDTYDRVTRALLYALIHGLPMHDRRALDYMLSLARRDAHLYGPLGVVGYQRMRQGLRNLSLSLDTKVVSKYLDKLIGTVEPVAGDVLKAALIAQFGPAAGFVLHGKDLALGKDDKQKKADKEKAAKGKRTRARRKPSKQERRQSMRRMSPAFVKRST